MGEARAPHSLSVFVSYTRADTVRLDRFVPALREAGCVVHMDDGKVYDHYNKLARSLREAIRDCNVMVVALSPAAIESRWVRSETNLALRLEKPIFPVVVRAVELPQKLKRKHAFDLHDDENLQEPTRQLIEAINLAPQAPTRVGWRLESLLDSARRLLPFGLGLKG